MKFSHCLHIALVTGKHTDVSRGILFKWGVGGRGYVEDLSMEEVLMGEGKFI